MRKLVVGIDPGASGAAAIMNVRTKKVIDCIEFSKVTLHELADRLEASKQESKLEALIENVHAMPKQGVSSSFKFGRRVGEVEGILVALMIPYSFVTPRIWQRDMRCLSKGDKRKTRARAQQLYPSLKITHGKADAILIARWGCER